MKKTLLGILIGLVILAVGVTTAFAAGPGGRHHGTGATGTGVCRYVDANGDGICDNRGTGCGQGGGYADADGDGVCDNYTGGQGGHHGSGHGGGCRR